MFLNDTHRKADELVKAGKFDESLEIYNNLIILHPDNADMLGEMGVIFIHLNDREKCFYYLNAALDLEPSRSYRYSCRAYAHGHFKDYDASIMDYQRAIELDPEDSIAHNNLGLALEQKGYNDEAQKRFEQADKLAKAEEKMFSVLDELEANRKASPEGDMNEIPSEEIETRLNEEEKSNTWKEIKKFFTSAQQRKDFIRFIKNGFKIK